MIYMRGQSRDYDQWRQLGNTGWGWDDVRAIFHEVGRSGRSSPDDLHGEGGEWRVENQRLAWDFWTRSRAAAAGRHPQDRRFQPG